jgi:hypothetical protein
MNKIALSVLGSVAALAMAPAAQATTFVTPNPGAGGIETGVVGNNQIDTVGEFTDNFTLDFGQTGLFSLSLTEVAAQTANNLEFLSVTVNGVAATLFSAPGGEPDFASLVGLAIAGVANITVHGTSNGNGVYGGTYSFAPSSAVPEPATWAMMLIGFGGIGYSMRRRPARRLVQAI